MRVYAAILRPTAAGSYSYRYDWIFLRPEMLTGDRFWVVLSHELGHATLDHRPVDGRPEYVRATRMRYETDANRRGVEIMVRSVRRAARSVEQLRSDRAILRGLHDHPGDHALSVRRLDEHRVQGGATPGARSGPLKQPAGGGRR